MPRAWRLLANTAPVAFGSLGIPIITLGKMTNIDANVLSIMAGRQLPFFSLLIPVWMVLLMSGWRGLKQVWPAVLVAGGSFAAVQFVVSQHCGPMLVDVAGGLVSLVVMGDFLEILAAERTVALRRRAGDDSRSGRRSDRRVGIRRIAANERDEEECDKADAPHRYTRGEVAKAWVPWLLMSVFVFFWGLPQVHVVLEGKTAINVEVPAIHKHIYRTEPVAAPGVEPEKAEFKFNWLTATGTAVMFASMLSAVWLGVSPWRFLVTLLRTLRTLAWPLFTIAAMLAIAYTTKYSGTDATLGLAFTHTGALYPFFAPLLGWLGVALTGSDTASNALFGDLQRITAERLHFSSVLICTSNSTGGVMGKMIDAQSIVVSAVDHRPGRQRIANPPLRLLAQPGAGLPDGIAGGFASVCADGHGAGCAEVRGEPPPVGSIGVSEDVAVTRNLSYSTSSSCASIAGVKLPV